MIPYPLAKPLLPMKPCKLHMDHPVHVQRLNEALDRPVGVDSTASRYVAERKWDGCRYLAIKGRMFSHHISATTGWPVEKTAQLQPLAGQLCRPDLAHLILDGEVIFPGGKAQDVVSIAGCLPEEARQRQDRTPLHYMVFDVLRTCEGEPLIRVPWRKRRAYLESIANEIESRTIRVVHVITDHKRAFLDSELVEGREGIILKHVDSLYHTGKRPMWEWIKVKAQDETDVVITGFEPPERLYTGKAPDGWPYREGDELVTKLWYEGWIGSITFGAYDSSGELVSIGACSGVDEATRADMSRRPNEYVGKVARIQFMEWTRDGALRHPRFLGLHPDKLAHECRLPETEQLG